MCCCFRQKKTHSAQLIKKYEKLEKSQTEEGDPKGFESSSPSSSPVSSSSRLDSPGRLPFLLCSWEDPSSPDFALIEDSDKGSPNMAVV